MKDRWDPLQERPLVLCGRQKVGVCSPITAPSTTHLSRAPSQGCGVAGCSPKTPFSQVGNPQGNHRPGFQSQHGFPGVPPGQTSLASTSILCHGKGGVPSPSHEVCEDNMRNKGAGTQEAPISLAVLPGPCPADAPSYLRTCAGLRPGGLLSPAAHASWCPGLWRMSCTAP